MITVSIMDNFKYIALYSDDDLVDSNKDLGTRKYGNAKCFNTTGIITWRRNSDGTTTYYCPLFTKYDHNYPKTRYESNPYKLMKFVYFYTKYLTDLKIPFKLRNADKFKFTTDGGKLHACYLRYRI